MIKLIVSDIDGVWTNGEFIYSANGDSLRVFTTKDSFGVSLSRLAGIPIMWLSGEENPMVRARAEKLKIDHVFLGIGKKIRVLEEFCKEQGIDLSEVAYIGDDLNDWPLLGKVGFFACPADAHPDIREEASKVLRTQGGQGAFREFIEVVLRREGIWEECYKALKQSYM